jgi:hypothetical protein
MNSILNWLVTKQLRPVLVNWKTSLVGLLILLPNLQEILANFGGILQVLLGVADGQNLDVEKLKLLATQLGAGVALLFARDANKSSEQSGTKAPLTASIFLK